MKNMLIHVDDRCDRSDSCRSKRCFSDRRRPASVEGAAFQTVDEVGKSGFGESVQGKTVGAGRIDKVGKPEYAKLLGNDGGRDAELVRDAGNGRIVPAQECDDAQAHRMSDGFYNVGDAGGEIMVFDQ